MSFTTWRAHSLRRLLSSIDESAATFERYALSMGELNRHLESIIEADIGRLNSTQRAIYFAHRRGGLHHFEIMEMF